MKNYIIAAVLALTSLAAAASCTYHTYRGPNGQTLYCTTCCYGSNNCTTTCH